MKTAIFRAGKNGVLRFKPIKYYIMTTFQSITKVVLLSAFLIGFGLTASAQTVTNNTLCDMDVALAGEDILTQDCDIDATFDVTGLIAGNSIPIVWVPTPGGTGFPDYVIRGAFAAENGGTGDYAIDNTLSCYPTAGGTGSAGCLTFTVTIDAAGNVNID